MRKKVLFDIYQSFAIKQAMLIVCLPHCLTAIVGHGKALKPNFKNCSCKNCSCAGHDGQIICQPVAPWCSALCVYTNTYVYIYAKYIKKENIKGYEKLPWKYRLIICGWGKCPLNAKLNKALSSDKGRNYQASRVTHPCMNLHRLCVDAHTNNLATLFNTM